MRSGPMPDPLYPPRLTAWGIFIDVEFEKRTISETTLCEADKIYLVTPCGACLINWTPAFAGVTDNFPLSRNDGMTHSLSSERRVVALLAWEQRIRMIGDFATVAYYKNNR